MEKKEREHRPPLTEAEASSLSSSSVLARVNWRYRPDSYVVAPKGTRIGDYLHVDSVDLGNEVVKVVNIASLSTRQALILNFLDSFDRGARKATEEEVERYLSNLEEEKEISSSTRSESNRLRLGMKILGSFVSLDRSKVLITYTTEGDRADFRELLRIIAGRFRIRIEFRQLHARDAAQAIGGIGVCGLPLCCRAFLTSFNTITINMAKNQLLPVNNSKLSGQCNRLMCCLAYENDLYAQLRPSFPHQGSAARIGDKIYKVISLNVLSDSIVATDGNSYEYFTSAEWTKFPTATKSDFNAQINERKQHE